MNPKTIIMTLTSLIQPAAAPDASPHYDRLTAALKDDSPWVRLHAAEALIALGHPDPAPAPLEPPPAPPAPPPPPPPPPAPPHAPAAPLPPGPPDSPAKPHLRLASGHDAVRDLARDPSTPPSAKYLAAMWLADFGT